MRHTLSAGHRRTRTVAWVTAAVGVLVGLVVWGLSSAPGSSPDDNFHLTSIYCISDGSDEYCPRSGSAYRVPGALVTLCFAFKPDVSAACDDGVAESLREDDYVGYEWWNHQGLYPPVFYATMAPFASDDLAGSVIAMRTANVVVFVLLVGAVLWLVPVTLRPPVLLGVVVTMVPLTAFLIPSTNPSSWALISAATVWPALLGHLRTTGRRSWALGALAVVATVVGAGARADAAMYAVGAVVVVALLEVRRSSWRWRMAIVPGIIVAISATMFLTTKQGGSALSGVSGGTAEGSTLSLIWKNLIDMPALIAGVSSSPLGWLDTGMTPTVWVLAGAVFWAVLFVGIGKTDWRKTVAIICLFTAMWVVPMVMLIQAHAVVGTIAQPRYILPIAIILIGVSALPVARGRVRLSGLQVVAMALALTAANASALNTNIVRYTTGTDQNRFNLDAGVEWWWGSPVPGPMAVWVIGVVAMGAFFAASAWLLWDAGRDTTAAEEPSGAPNDDYGAVTGTSGQPDSERVADQGAKTGDDTDTSVGDASVRKDDSEPARSGTRQSSDSDAARL